MMRGDLQVNAVMCGDRAGVRGDSAGMYGEWGRFGGGLRWMRGEGRWVHGDVRPKGPQSRRGRRLRGVKCSGRRGFLSWVCGDGRGMCGFCGESLKADLADYIGYIYRICAGIFKVGNYLMQRCLWNKGCE